MSKAFVVLMKEKYNAHCGILINQTVCLFILFFFSVNPINFTAQQSSSGMFISFLVKGVVSTITDDVEGCLVSVLPILVLLWIYIDLKHIVY